MNKRLERTENTTIQDIALASALGISEKEIIEMDLFQTKNKLQQYAWSLEYNNKKITQEKADILNKKFQDTMEELDAVSDIDFSADYWIDFNNYVKNEKKKCFMYIPDENYKG